ncbi:hypothetical protein COU61_00235 [Candidatus Pacearchaeota archaeon CG10_big_fil_rev_8_21_14_0_10_35_13]|nr:MAG: hypothetical protein COU61_00235 [Candidatus Pacearchaeota archaeon CG10_big_fil_rev_8_21_14_0_10_35_13]
MIKKLNLGSGKDYKKGEEWTNLDYNNDYKTDVNHDLDKYSYPFKDEEFDYVYCSHILEHVKDLFKTLREIERIIKPGGKFHIRVPHFSNGNGYNDLTHRRFFGWHTFPQLLEGYYRERYNFKIKSMRFNYLAEGHQTANKLFSWFFNILPKQFYERFLCWVLPVGEIELLLKKIK